MTSVELPSEHAIETVLTSASPKRPTTNEELNMTAITREELADLLVETGHHHHQAYETSDGVDPEWALWYAGYLQSQLFGRTPALPSRSSLVHLLVQGDKEFVPTDVAPEWPLAYADLMLTEFLGSD